MTLALRIPTWMTGLALVLATSRGIATPPEKSESFPQILTYGQLMSLSEDKQIIYIQGLRRILVELAAYPQNGNRLITGNKDFRSPATTEPAAVSVEISLANPPPSEPSVPANNAPAAKVTLPIPTATTDTGANINSADGKTAKAVSQPGSQANPDGNNVATSPSTSDQLPVMSDADIKKLSLDQIVPRIPSEGSKNISCDKERGIVLFTPSGNPNVRGCRMASFLPRSSCNLTQFVPVSQESNGLFFCMTKASFDALNEADRNKLRAPHPKAKPDTTAWKYFNEAQPPYRQPSPPSPSASTENNPSPKTTAAPAPTEKCQIPSLPACQTTDPEQARRDFYNDPKAPNTCVYAGNISQYKGPTRARNGCKRVSESPLKLTTGQPLSCDNRKDAICNPLLFGVKNDGTAICLPPPHGQVTSRCDKHPIATVENAKTFVTNNVNGLQDAWNDFRNGFNELCYNSKSSHNFHCAECAVMATRLAELNKIVIGNCSGGASTGKSTSPQPANEQPSENSGNAETTYHGP